MLWQHIYQNQTDTKISMDPAQGWHVNSWSIPFFSPQIVLTAIMWHVWDNWKIRQIWLEQPHLILWQSDLVDEGKAVDAT